MSVADKLEYLKRLKTAVGIRYQKLMDDSTPHTVGRWIATAGFLLLYVLRLWWVGGFYIITYALGIYVLNILLAFLTPQIDPETEEGDGSQGPSILPTKNNEEFRPFIRRLPEFKFWHRTTRAVLIAIACTFFEILNIPVFWPILLIYFIALFTVTMKKQIQHMIKHKYIPFNFGKPKYQKSNK